MPIPNSVQGNLATAQQVQTATQKLEDLNKHLQQLLENLKSTDKSLDVLNDSQTHMNNIINPLRISMEKP
eukprot:Nk52_evm1s956 gene=Nk52_evmTU1s956